MPIPMRTQGTDSSHIVQGARHRNNQTNINNTNMFLRKKTKILSDIYFYLDTLDWFPFFVLTKMFNFKDTRYTR